jgi:hypothetical protein
LPIAPPIRRLTKRIEFLFVRQGARASHGVVTVEARRRAAGGPIGLGLTASKKVGGRQQTPEASWDALLDDVRNALIRLRADLETGAAQVRREPRARTPSQTKNKGAKRAKGD